ncbi:MAG: helix-turn-helix transcriptional regulator [Pontimonas sp.]
MTLPPAHLNAPADFGIALQQARMSRAMTQQELATLVGVPQSTVSQMESGQTTLYLRRLLDLAQATGLHFQATWDDHD